MLPDCVLSVEKTSRFSDPRHLRGDKGALLQSPSLENNKSLSAHPLLRIHTAEDI